VGLSSSRARRKLFLGSAVVASSAAPAQAQDVPMFRGNPAHTGVAVSPALATLSKVKWQFHTKGRVYSTPAIVGGTVYIGSTDGLLYAIDEATGAERWTFKTDARITSSPAVHAGTVFFTSFDGFCYAVNAATGKLSWKFKTSGERRFAGTHLHGWIPLGERMPDPYDVYLSSPAVAESKVYFGSGDGNVYALDETSGHLTWKFHTGDVVHASPAIAGGVVYIGSWDTYFYALDASNGLLKWRFKTGVDAEIHNQEGITSSAAVVDGIVYFGCRDGHLYALDASTGRKKWSFDAEHAWVTSSPAVRDGRVYFGAGTTHVFLAVDAKTGAQLFSVGVARGILASPTIAGDFAYIGNFDGTLSAIDLRSRRVAWVFQTDSARVAAAAFERAGGNLVTGADSAEHGFYDERVMNFAKSNANAILSSAVVVKGLVFLGSADGNLYALQ
jgi:eukaryotic-like serine/threonine-protein kinase